MLHVSGGLPLSYSLSTSKPVWGKGMFHMCKMKGNRAVFVSISNSRTMFPHSSLQRFGCHDNVYFTSRTPRCMVVQEIVPRIFLLFSFKVSSTTKGYCNRFFGWGFFRSWISKYYKSLFSYVFSCSSTCPLSLNLSYIISTCSSKDSKVCEID